MWIQWIESGKIAAFLALNAFAGVEIDLRCVRQIFLSALLHFFELDRCVPFHNYIKTFNWFWGSREKASLWSGLHRWTADWVAKSTAVEYLTQFRVNVQSMEPNISGLCRQATKTPLLFPTTYCYEAFFQHCNYFKHPNPLQPKHNIVFILFSQS